MGLWAGLNTRVKRLSFFDVKLIQVATVCFTVLVIKFVPRIIIIRKEWFIACLLLAALKPVYVFLVKK